MFISGVSSSVIEVQSSSEQAGHAASEVNTMHLSFQLNLKNYVALLIIFLLPSEKSFDLILDSK